MSIFAPVYRPTKHQQTLLVRQQKVASRKRKRGRHDSDEDEGETQTRLTPEPDLKLRTASTAFHPINKTDPYFVAGHSRELPLPPLPFPHAAIKHERPTRRPIQEELAELNPPLYVLPEPEDKSASLKRRHLDNLTTILHKCMLNGDWQRAFRAWSLLIRTEIGGRAVDVRRNGRWTIGAELLMRRGQSGSNERLSNDEAESSFAKEGFKLARDYYERLILQYPHTPSSMHTFNATAVYPALLNVWIYEVQDRFKRARNNVTSHDQRSDHDENELESDVSLDAEQVEQLHQVRIEELNQALPIAQRMDELFLSPPYDTMSELLRLRGMMALWIADLHEELANLLRRSLESQTWLGESETDAAVSQAEIDRHRDEGDAAQKLAEQFFEKAGME